ncbi:MoaD/ThiS family protein [Arachidicoccus sp.]|uniref:MoaD/ThiS family protein n=1 Tax=Arachidicoccus sp. TaxID=1872624 RepID=UPI003D191AAF
MQITLLLFGQTAAIMKNEQVVINDIKDTDALRNYLLKQYPSLASINYAIAVDEQIITTNTLLKEKYTVAILPPFSGG